MAIAHDSRRLYSYDASEHQWQVVSGGALPLVFMFRFQLNYWMCDIMLWLGRVGIRLWWLAPRWDYVGARESGIALMRHFKPERLKEGELIEAKMIRWGNQPLPVELIIDGQRRIVPECLPIGGLHQ